MPNLRLSFVGTAGTTTYNSPDLTVQQETAVIDWLWAEYAPKDANGAVLTRNTANEAQAFRNWARSIARGLNSAVRAREHNILLSQVVVPTFPEG